MKSINILHLLPFTFLYIFHNNLQFKDKKKRDEMCKTDVLYKYIPNKSKDISEKIKWIAIVAPLLLMLIKSTKSAYLEHTFVVISFAIFLKVLIQFLTPCLPKFDISNIIYLCTFLNIFYFDILPKEHIQIGYLVSLMYSVLLLSMRDTTSANIIMDYVIAHSVFLYLRHH